MRTKTPPSRRKFTGVWDEIDYLHHKVLHWFYGRGDRRKAVPFADRLERLLDATPEGTDTILAEECRSLIWELRGDLARATKHREKEVRLIRKLHELAVGSPQREAILSYYDHSDLSDRLDLLAILYHDAGKLERAIEILRESKRYCAAHGIPFDGQDLLDDYQAEKKEVSRAG
jgi:hypothetical protein